MTTVSPTYDEATGNIIGSEIQPPRGGWSSSPSDYIEDEVTGERHHVYENVSLTSEQQGFDQDDYFSTLAASNPSIPAALQWASETLPEDAIRDYNSSVDSGDLDAINSFLESIVAQYEAQLGVDQALEEPSDTVSEEEVTSHISQLQTAEPDYNLAHSFMEAAVSATSEAEQVLYSLAVEFHSGRLSADECIEAAYTRLPQDQLYKAYQLINQ